MAPRWLPAAPQRLVLGPHLRHVARHEGVALRRPGVGEAVGVAPGGAVLPQEPAGTARYRRDALLARERHVRLDEVEREVGG